MDDDDDDGGGGSGGENRVTGGKEEKEKAEAGTPFPPLFLLTSYLLTAPAPAPPAGLGSPTVSAKPRGPPFGSYPSKQLPGSVAATSAAAATAVASPACSFPRKGRACPRRPFLGGGA